MRNGELSHALMGGKLHVFRRERSSRWQCSTYLAGREHRISAKTDSLAQAKAFAEDWYLTLRGKVARGEVSAEKTFKEAAAAFEREYEIITEGQRSPAYVRGHKDRLRLHLNPFFGSMPLSQVTASAVQEYRIKRLSLPVKTKPKEAAEGEAAAKDKKKSKEPKEATRPARTTLHHELVTLRQVLKTAIRHGWLQHLPDLTAPYRTSGKIAHRAWFSPEEYQQLYKATRARAADKKNHRHKAAAQLHDYVLFMANTGLRPDEAARLQYRDVTIVDDEATSEQILEISVRGKRGVGFCKSTRGAVRPFERIRERNVNDRPTREELKQRKAEGGKASERKAAPPKPTDLLFPTRQTMLLNKVLADTGLKEDREGQARTAYSLRHTYICMRLMEGADIYQVAKNCRTSVEMIEKYYASHIKTRLDAAAINVRRRPVASDSEGEITP
jgi:integrase